MTIGDHYLPCYWERAVGLEKSVVLDDRIYFY